MVGFPSREPIIAKRNSPIGNIGKRSQKRSQNLHRKVISSLSEAIAMRGTTVYLVVVFPRSQCWGSGRIEKPHPMKRSFWFYLPSNFRSVIWCIHSILEIVSKFLVLLDTDRLGSAVEYMLVLLLEMLLTQDVLENFCPHKNSVLTLLDYTCIIWGINILSEESTKDINIWETLHGQTACYFKDIACSSRVLFMSSRSQPWMTLVFLDCNSQKPSPPALSTRMLSMALFA